MTVAALVRPRWVICVEMNNHSRGFYTGTRNAKGKMVLAPRADHPKTLAYIARSCADRDCEIARNLACGGSFRFWVELRAAK